MARVWEARWDVSTIGGTGNWNPVNGLMTFPGGGTAGDVIGGTFFANIAMDPFIWLDGVPTAIADLPLYFEVDDAYELVAGLVNNNPSGADTCDIVFQTLGTVTPPTSPPSPYYPRTGMTLAALLALEGTSIIATASATCDFNGQSTAQAVSGNWGVRGTFTTLIPEGQTPMIDAGQGADIQPPLPATVTATGTFENAPPGGATVTYLWEFISGPDGAVAPVISDPTLLETDITFSEKIFGLYTFKLSSSGDPAYGVPASSDTVTFIIPVPRAPIITPVRTTVTP